MYSLPKFVGKSKKKPSTNFGNYSLRPHQSEKSKTWVCGESTEFLFILKIWKNQMLVVLDGTNSKTPTFGVKRPEVHHFLYPNVQPTCCIVKSCIYILSYFIFYCALLKPLAYCMMMWKWSFMNFDFRNSKFWSSKLKKEKGNPA